MKNGSMKLLAELLKNSKKSDRQLAKTLGVSQPTITRMRSKLVSEGLIQEFTVMPDFAKIGFEIFAISVIKGRGAKDVVEKARKWMDKYPNIIFAARAEGMGYNGVMMSLHKSYSEYSKFVTESQAYWADTLEEYQTILISLRGPVVRPLSLRYLADLF